MKVAPPMDGESGMNKRSSFTQSPSHFILAVFNDQYIAKREHQQRRCVLISEWKILKTLFGQHHRNISQNLPVHLCTLL